MYIDPSDPARTMDQEVNEATAALKGLLGIGVSSAVEVMGSTANPKMKDSSSSPPPTTPTGREENEMMDTSRQGSKKRYRKKKSTGFDQQQQHHQQNQQQTTHYHNRSSRGGGNPGRGGGRHNHNHNHNHNRDNHSRDYYHTKDGRGTGNPPTSSKKNNNNSNKHSNNYRKNKKKDTMNKDTSNSRNSVPTSQNFAWSAFQSSPDASKLPTPDFVSPTVEKEVVNLPNTEPFSVLLAGAGDYRDVRVNNQAPSAIIIENAPKAEDLEDRVIAEAKKNQAEAGAGAEAEAEAEAKLKTSVTANVLSSSQNHDDPALDDGAASASVHASKVSDTSPSSSPATEIAAADSASPFVADAGTTEVVGIEKPNKQNHTGDAEKRTSAARMAAIAEKKAEKSSLQTANVVSDVRHSPVPNSKTGINISAVINSTAGKTSNANTSITVNNISTTPTTSGSATSNTPTGVSHQQRHIQLQQQQQQQQQQSHLNTLAPQQQYQLHHPANAAAGYSAPPAHQYAPPPTHGYVTIQVQVPMVLMPGRQMVVTSPAGYPVRVVVPEGIPPGMVIPVHVPTGIPMHPHHHQMMPPSGTSPYGNYYHHPR